MVVNESNKLSFSVKKPPKASVLKEDTIQDIVTCHSVNGSETLHGMVSLYIKSIHMKGAPQILYKTGYYVPTRGYFLYNGIQMLYDHFELEYRCQIDGTDEVKLNKWGGGRPILKIFRLL